jgi:hypothetical protein
MRIAQRCCVGGLVHLVDLAGELVDFVITFHNFFSECGILIDKNLNFRLDFANLVEHGELTTNHVQFRIHLGNRVLHFFLASGLGGRGRGRKSLVQSLTFVPHH